jgi:hypothetical protein
MKTAAEWVATLPLDVQYQIHRNIEYPISARLYPYESLHDLICSAFRWNETPEGDEYWRNIARGNYTPFYQKYLKN